MFLISLTYVQPLTEVDKYLPEHKLFLDKYYALGHFLVSGRKVPRTGGVIIARFDTPEAVQHALADDPFFQHKVATYEVTELQPTQCIDALKGIFMQ